jgi:molecular chaperone DnaK
MSYRLAVDLGTAFAAAAVVNGSDPVMVGLGNRSMQIPSVLFLTDDEAFLVGEAAERRGALEPDRLVREFKRRFGDPVPMLVAGAAYSPESLMARLLRWIVATTTTQQGEAPAEVMLTHPANWGPYKRELLDQVASLADLPGARYCTEPEAAAVRYAARTKVDVGDRIAVYDLGGGTFDVCVLEKRIDGFSVLGTPDGIEHLGGADVDEAVTHLVLQALGPRLETAALDDPGMSSASPDCAATAWTRRRRCPATPTSRFRSRCPG